MDHIISKNLDQVITVEDIYDDASSECSCPASSDGGFQDYDVCIIRYLEDRYVCHDMQEARYRYRYSESQENKLEYLEKHLDDTELFSILIQNKEFSLVYRTIQSRKNLLEDLSKHLKVSERKLIEILKMI